MTTDPANFPRCAARNLLRTLDDDTLRVNFNTLYLSFTPEEKRFWGLSSKEFPADEHGPYPEGVEQFFVLMEKSADMAKKKAAGGTATKERPARKKAAKKKAANRLRTTMDEASTDPAVVAAAEAKVAKPAKDANDPGQPNLPGIETDRIPGIETAVKRIVNAEKERRRLKEEIEEDRGKVATLLEKNDRSQYKCLGEVWYTEPGGTVLKRKKIKDK